MSATGADPVYPLPRPRLKDTPARERPRELFERLGAEHVSESVLLAILLRTGARGSNVVDLADLILRQYGSLSALSRAPASELSKIYGMGKVKAQVLIAALQLATRMADESAQGSRMIRTPEDAAAVLRETARTREEEAFWVLLLNTKNGMKGRPREITRGLLDASLVHPREVFKHAILESCAAVVMVHNHPSGDPSPSAEDIKITRQLVEAGRIVDIEVLDHVILGRTDGAQGDDFFSIRESGMVDFAT